MPRGAGLLLTMACTRLPHTLPPFHPSAPSITVAAAWASSRKQCRPRRVCEARAVEVDLPGLPPIVFAETGSGLLWARTTGLKVWTGAKVIAASMASPAFSFQLPAAWQQVAGETGGDGGRRSCWDGKFVLELGCGLGLCSVVAAMQGAKVRIHACPPPPCMKR